MERFSPQDVPNKPGVYLFRSAAGEVVYVGKARSLRKRLSSYFQPSRDTRADPKLRALIHSIEAYEIMEVRTESEALILESQLIKQYHPRYNVELRDDKRYLHLCLDPGEPFPRFQYARIRRNDNRLYFGPFPFARVLRETADFLAKRFGLRTYLASQRASHDETLAVEDEGAEDLTAAQQGVEDVGGIIAE